MKNKKELLNDWETFRVIKKDKILNFNYLYNNNYIKEIEEGYYYLTESFITVKRAFYAEENEKMKDKLNIKDVEKEYKALLKEIKEYNDLKDTAQNLILRIAELRGVTYKEVEEELGYEFNE